MVIRRDKTIAYKCFECGFNEINTLNIFNLSKEGEYIIECSDCGGSRLTIQKGVGKYTLIVDCFICSEHHVYTVSDKSFWADKPFSFACLSTGFDICFIGSKKEVEAFCDQLDEELDAMEESYEEYESKEQGELMVNALNRIHDIAKGGNLFCICGSTDIGLDITPEGIKLLCRKCGATEFIDSFDDMAVEKLMTRTSIVLSKKNVVKGFNAHKHKDE